MQTAAVTVFATHIGIGGALFYGVMKFFDAVGDRLNEDTQLEIAVWLLGVKVAPTAEDRLSVLLKLFRAGCGTARSTKRAIVALILTSVNGMLSGLSTGNKYAGMSKFNVETLYFAFSLTLILVVLNANEQFLAKTAGFRALLISVLTIALAVVAGVIAMVLWQRISFARGLSSPHLGTVMLRLSIVPTLTSSIFGC